MHAPDDPAQNYVFGDSGAYGQDYYWTEEQIDDAQEMAVNRALNEEYERQDQAA